MSVDFNKNGVATAASFGNAAAPLQEMEIKSLDDGSVWARIHYLDVARLDEWFADEAEVMKCIDKTNRYSRMGIVDMFRQSDGTFEFMLDYPTALPGYYNRWSQTSSPNTDHGSSTGFVSIHCGLYSIGPIVRRPTLTNTIYTCDNESTEYWHHPIGQLQRYTSLTPDGVEYVIPSRFDIQCTSVELWVRIDQLPETSICQIFDNSITATSFIEI